MDFRLFGTLICKNLCRIEDADHKLSIILNGIPYGTETLELFEYINRLLAPGIPFSSQSKSSWSCLTSSQSCLPKTQ